MNIWDVADVHDSFKDDLTIHVGDRGVTQGLMFELLTRYIGAETFVSISPAKFKPSKLTNLSSKMPSKGGFV